MKRGCNSCPWSDHSASIPMGLPNLQDSARTDTDWCPRQPNRIRRDKPPDIRIVEPEGVVVQPRFAVQVLALEAQVLLFDKEAFLLFGQGVAPHLITGLPDAAAVVFGELLRQAVWVGVVIAQTQAGEKKGQLYLLNHNTSDRK